MPLDLGSERRPTFLDPSRRGTDQRRRGLRRGVSLLPSMFTVGNMFCGYACIAHAMHFEFESAAQFIGIAIVLDMLDGRIARLTGTTSAFGREFDSLADVISFGVAPAAIAFAAGVNTRLDQAILLFFTACGLSRLARFNVTAESLAGAKGKVEYFEGTPIPTSVVPLGILMLTFHAGNLYRMHILGVTVHAVALPFLVSGALMISKTLRIPKP